MIHDFKLQDSSVINLQSKIYNLKLKTVWIKIK